MGEEAARKYPLVLKRAKLGSFEKEDRRGKWSDVTDESDPLHSILKDKVGESFTARQREVEGLQQVVDASSKKTTRQIHVETRLAWNEQKIEVLAKYTTEKDIPVHSKIVEDEVERESKILSDADRARQKLEQLEDDKKSDGMSYFAQSDLVKHLESLATELEASWKRDEKVKALRIVIQACKLLSVIKVPQCYPSLFVLTAKVLDVFGNLVYERIYQKAVETLGVRKLADNFKPTDVSAETKDVCRNWFYKIASIRELIPRILVEMALWKCNRFIEGDEHYFSKSYKRFAMQIRGIGDPLLAIHARWYLCHKGYDLDKELSGTINVEYAEICLSDFYHCRPTFSDGRLDKFLQMAQMSPPEYIALFSPVLRWLIELVAFKSQTLEQLDKMIQDFRDNGSYAVVMQHLIGSFEGPIVLERLPEIVEYIETTTDTTCTKGDLWYALGAAMIESPPEAKQDKQNILNKAWDDVVKLGADDFMKCSGVWVEYSVFHLERKDVDLLLRVIVERLTEDKVYETQQVRLKRLLVIVLENWRSLTQVFSLDSFMPLLDMLKGDLKRNTCLHILSLFADRAQKTKDDVLIGSLVDVGRSLHDELTAMSPPEEKKQISMLMLRLMDNVSYEKDYEGQLNFYAECRRSFHKLQDVIEEAIHGAVRLMQEVVHLHGVKSHTKKIGVFVKTCLTFVHITIPSIRNRVEKAKLFMITGYMANALGFLAQGELLLKECVETIDAGRSEEVQTQLVAVQGPLLRYILASSCADNNGTWVIRELLRIVDDSSGGWDKLTSQTKANLYLQSLRALVQLHKHRISLGEDDEADVAFGDLVSEVVELAMNELKRKSDLLAAASTPPAFAGPLKEQISQFSFELFLIVARNCELFDQTAALLRKLFAVTKSVSPSPELPDEAKAMVARAEEQLMASNPNLAILCKELDPMILLYFS
ncbi:UPF0505 protein [Diplonema papillatum]|nr:UPF0505 protein [Diplonema papillatum]